MTKVNYLETSTFLQVVFQETGWEESRMRIENSERLISSRLLRIEVSRALLRLRLNSTQDELAASELTSRCDSMFAAIDLVEISSEICMRAERVFPAQLIRSLDAIHVATYLLLKEKFGGLEMLSHDRMIRQVLKPS